MAGRAQLKFVMTECSKTQIRLTGLNNVVSRETRQVLLMNAIHRATAKTHDIGSLFESKHHVFTCLWHVFLCIPDPDKYGDAS